MNRLRLFSILVLTLVALVPTLLAYDIVLKNGTTIHFQNFRIAGDRLFYVSENGQDTSIQLSEIDVVSSNQLNAKADPRLVLPEEVPAADGKQTPASLGDIPSQLNSTRKVTSIGRVFTNDDFPASPVTSAASDASAPSPNPQGATQNNSDWNAYKDRIGRFLEKTEGLTEQQNAARILGPELEEVRFPRRAEWQSKIYSQLQNYRDDAILCISDRVSDEGRRQRNACSRLDSEKYELKSRRERGRQLGQKWKSERDLRGTTE
jgi:hypothetical protein